MLWPILEADTYSEYNKQQSPRRHVKLPWGLLLFSAYLPIQKDPRCTRVWNLPVDVQIIQWAGVGVTDMLVDPTFVQFTEVAFCEDGTAF